MINCLPLTSQTFELFDDKMLQNMKETSVFVNIGRGKTVNEANLVESLQIGTIKHAVLDVFYVEPLSTDSKLWDLPNVTITPHCANTTSEGHSNSFKIFMSNLETYTSGKQL